MHSIFKMTGCVHFTVVIHSSKDTRFRRVRSDYHRYSCITNLLLKSILNRKRQGCTPTENRGNLP